MIRLWIRNPPKFRTELRVMTDRYKMGNGPWKNKYLMWPVLRIFGIIINKKYFIGMMKFDPKPSQSIENEEWTGH
jgi:hypothetical protein